VIVAAIAAHFAAAAAPGALAGRRIVVTSGPTREPIDPVRYLSNASSGRQGVAIAEALARRGAEVVFVTGPADAANPRGCAVVPVVTAQQMHDAVLAALPADAAIMVAAVSDWRVAEPGAGKLKKQDGMPPPALDLVLNPDILAAVAQLPLPQRPPLVVGFAAETENLLENARAKRRRKGCDWLLANDVGTDSGVFGGAENHVHFLAEGEEEDWGQLAKEEVGDRLAERLVRRLAR
jgi:phosphopantothenoylcysteine decarboxylase/phosphopantothenate--cysteine ligase